jgi:serine/threonine protein kinase
MFRLLHIISKVHLVHRNLHENARVLHRDISPGNILLNPTGAVGNRAFLIDFDHAVRLDDSSPYARQPRMVPTFFIYIHQI